MKSDLTHVERADPGRKAYEIILIPAYHAMLLETEKSEIISWEQRKKENWGLMELRLICLLKLLSIIAFFFHL